MAGRTLHYVIRCTDLRKGLRFFEEVFAMKVLRHEENAEPCPIACNGKYNSAWSKTMVGYDKHTEDKYFCLEVVYNYGVEKYPPPSGALGFAIGTPDPAAALRKAADLGYAVQGSSISGPDGYTYEVDALAGRAEPFRYSTVAVDNLARSKAWYLDVWGFEDLSAAYPSCGAGECYVGWNACEGCGESVPLRLVETPGVKVDPQVDGRFAVALPTGQLKARCAVVEKDHAAHVVHPMRVLAEDKLGALYLAITKDPDGHELCTVSKETFDPAVANPPYNAPDWEWREKFIKGGSAALVADKAPAAGAVDIALVDDDSWEDTINSDGLTVVWFAPECASSR
eukprot:TRINITY_DN15692_c0_g1_i2.p1 TRINITY_DN15692_c0_g1~~TRINITY_DN15692_c0_g1_i2.p1  ORF type:complete len:370 (+),score=134.92 TRINITY_DN15692_c0_g1_i2:93-1112(+)